MNSDGWQLLGISQDFVGVYDEWTCGVEVWIGLDWCGLVWDIMGWYWHAQATPNF